MRNPSRLWRFRIWLQFPRKIVPERNEVKVGALLKKVDVYPNILCHRSDKLIVELKHSTDKISNYHLDCYTLGDDLKTAWDSINEKVVLIIDTLSFAYQIGITKKQFGALDITPPLIIQSVRNCFLGNGLPDIDKDSRIAYIGDWSNKISPKLLNLDADDATEAALRWYAKGLSAGSFVEQFAFFWIALESLSLPVKKEKSFFKCSKCGQVIEECPCCHASSLHSLNSKQRIKELVVTELLYPVDIFESLYFERQMFHANNKLYKEDLERLVNQTGTLREITRRALKRRLKLSDCESPTRVNENALTAVHSRLQLTYTLTKEDINDFNAIKPLLKATLYKGTHFLG